MLLYCFLVSISAALQAVAGSRHGFRGLFGCGFVLYCHGIPAAFPGMVSGFRPEIKTKPGTAGGRGCLVAPVNRLKPFLAPFMSHPYIIPYKHKKPVKRPTDAPKRHIQPRHPSGHNGNPAPGAVVAAIPKNQYIVVSKCPPLYIAISKNREILGVCVILGIFKS